MPPPNAGGPSGLLAGLQLPSTKDSSSSSGSGSDSSSSDSDEDVQVFSTNSPQARRAALKATMGAKATIDANLAAAAAAAAAASKAAEEAEVRHRAEEAERKRKRAIALEQARRAAEEDARQLAALKARREKEEEADRLRAEVEASRERAAAEERKRQAQRTREAESAKYRQAASTARDLSPARSGAAADLVSSLTPTKAAPDSQPPTQYTIKLAAKVRAGFESTSADLGVAHVGEIITEIESRVNATGIKRVRYDRGWLSQKTADGRVILEPYDPLPEGWTTQTSRSTGRMYYVNHSTGQSTFDRNDPMIPKVVAPPAPAAIGASGSDQVLSFADAEKTTTGTRSPVARWSDVRGDAPPAASPSSVSTVTHGRRAGLVSASSKSLTPIKAAPDSQPPTQYTIKLAAKVRAGFESTSADLGVAHVGEIITEIESRVNATGIKRVRYDRGWLSQKTADGRVILEPYDPLPEGWTTQTSRSTGRMYYVNHSTGQSTFDRNDPMIPKVVAPPAPAPAPPSEQRSDIVGSYPIRESPPAAVQIDDTRNSNTTSTSPSRSTRDVQLEHDWQEFSGWARMERGASESDIESCRLLFESARQVFRTHLQRSRRKLEIQPPEMETMLGLYARHAKQAAASRQLLTEIENGWTTVKVPTSEAARFSECRNFYRAKLEFEVSERHYQEAVEMYKSGRGPDEATEDPDWAKFRDWAEQARGWGVRQDSALEGERRATFLSESKAIKSRITSAHSRTHIKQKPDESAADMQARHASQASALQKLLEELEKVWSKHRGGGKGQEETHGQDQEQTQTETVDAYRVYMRASLQDSLQVRHYEDMRRVYGTNAGTRPRSLLDNSGNDGDSATIERRGPLTPAEMQDKSEQLQSGTDEQWQMYKTWYTEVVDRAFKFMDNAVEEQQKSQFVEFGARLIKDFEYHKISKLAEAKPGEDIEDIRQRHQKETELVAKLKKDCVRDSERDAQRKFFAEWYFEEMYATIISERHNRQVANMQKQLDDDKRRLRGSTRSCWNAYQLSLQQSLPEIVHLRLLAYQVVHQRLAEGSPNFVLPKSEQYEQRNQRSPGPDVRPAAVNESSVGSSILTAALGSAAAVGTPQPSGEGAEAAVRRKYEAMTLTQLRKSCGDSWLSQTGTRETLIERLVDYEKPASGWPAPAPAPAPAPLAAAAANQYTIKLAAKVRAGFESTSADLGVAHVGEIITEIESRVNATGIKRVRYDRGWLSQKTADGRVILEPYDPLPEGWTTQTSRSTGRMYYVNHSTGQSTFDRNDPMIPKVVAPPAPAPAPTPAVGTPQPSGEGAEAAVRRKYEAMTLTQLRKSCGDSWLSQTGTRETLIERLVDYEKPASGWPAPAPVPAPAPLAAAAANQYTIKLAAKVRAGFESTSADLGVAHVGEIITEIESRVNATGIKRVRYDRGWLSQKTADGRVILEPYDPLPEGWTTQTSRSTGRMYYVNHSTGQSTFDRNDPMIPKVVAPPAPAPAPTPAVGTPQPSGEGAEAAVRRKYEAMTLTQLRKSCGDSWLSQTGTRETLIERLVDYEKPASGWPAPAPVPAPAPLAAAAANQYTIKLAAKVRAGFESTSADLGVAHVGEIITEIESRVNATGIKRVRYDRGWLSQKTADGRVILEPYDPLPEGWTTQTSRSTGRMYYVNHSTGQSTFDRNDPMIPKVVAPPAPAPAPTPAVGTPQPSGEGAEAAVRRKYEAMTLTQLRKSCGDSWLSQTGTRETLIERLVDYEKPASGWPAPAPAPAPAPLAAAAANQYTIKLAAKVRAGFESTSADLGVAHVGEIITEIESRVNATGIKRVRYDRGWLSQKTADGRVILEPYDPLPEGWTTQTSRSTGRMYYVNHSTGQSTFDRNDPMIPKVVAPPAPAPGLARPNDSSSSSAPSGAPPVRSTTASSRVSKGSSGLHAAGDVAVRAWDAARTNVVAMAQQVARVAAEQCYHDFETLFQMFDECQRSFQPSSTKHHIEGRHDMPDEEWTRYKKQHERKRENSEKAKKKVLSLLKQHSRLRSRSRDQGFVDWIQAFAIRSDQAEFRRLETSRQQYKAEQKAEAEKKQAEREEAERKARMKAEADRRELAKKRRSKRTEALQKFIEQDRNRCLSEEIAIDKKRKRHAYLSKDPTHATAEQLLREGDLEGALAKYKEVAALAKQGMGTFNVKDENDNAVLATAGHNYYAQGVIFERMATAADNSNLRKSLECHQFGLRIREKCYADRPYHPNIAISVAGIALAQMRMGDVRKSGKSMLRARRIVDTAAGKEGSTTAECLCVLAKVCHVAANKMRDNQEVRAQYKSAVEYYRRAIAIFENIGGPREVEIDLGISLNSLGSLLQERDDEGDSDEAWILFERARHIFERLEPNHIHVTMVLYNLATHHEQHGEFVVAERYYRRVLQLRIVEDYTEHLPWVLLHYPWVGEKVHEEQDNLNLAEMRHLDQGEYEESVSLAHAAVAEALDVRKRNVIARFSNEEAERLRETGIQLPSKCPETRRSWRCTVDGRDVILKELHISKLKSDEWKRHQDVLDSALVHPFLVEAERLSNRFGPEEDRLWAQFKFYKSTLRDFLPPQPVEAADTGGGLMVARLPDPQLKGLLVQLVMALYHIHNDQPPNVRVVHGNVSPENCVIDEYEEKEETNSEKDDEKLAEQVVQETTKDAQKPDTTKRLMLTDFRVGNPVTDGSFRYAAPELCNPDSIWYTGHDPKNEPAHDMYALGLIMFEAAFGRLPVLDKEDKVQWDGFTFADQAADSETHEERDAFQTIVTELLSHNPHNRPVASELLLSLYFAGSTLRTAVAANLHTNAALAALPLAELRNYGRTVQIQDQTKPAAERSARVDEIRRQYRRAMRTYSVTRAQIDVPARYALQHVADLSWPPLVGDCVSHARSASIGYSHGTFNFWKRVAEIYSSAFPQHADKFDRAHKEIEYLRKKAQAEDSEVDEDDLSRELEKAVLDLPPLKMEEVGELYESRGEFRSALEHYARNCRVFSAAVVADEHPCVEHENYLRSLFTARAAVHQVCKFRSDCMVDPPVGSSSSNTDFTVYRRQIEFDPDCEVVLSPEQDRQIVVDQLTDRALRECIDPDTVRIAADSDLAKQELITLLVDHKWKQLQSESSRHKTSEMRSREVQALREELEMMQPSRWSSQKRGTMFTFESGLWQRSSAAASAGDDAEAAKTALEKQTQQLREEQEALRRQVETLTDMLAVTNIEREKMQHILDSRHRLELEIQRTADMLDPIQQLQHSIESTGTGTAVAAPVLFWEARSEVGRKEFGVTVHKMRADGTPYYCKDGIEATRRFVVQGTESQGDYGSNGDADNTRSSVVDLVQAGYPLHIFTAKVPNPLAVSAEPNVDMGAVRPEQLHMPSPDGHRPHPVAVWGADGAAAAAEADTAAPADSGTAGDRQYEPVPGLSTSVLVDAVELSGEQQADQESSAYIGCSWQLATDEMITKRQRAANARAGLYARAGPV